MLRSSGRLGLALLLLSGFTASAQPAPAQTVPSQPALASSPKPASATSRVPAHKSKAHARKSTPVAEVPQTPPPPPTLEQQPPAPPRVSYQNGQLTIDSQNATLSQVLRSVQLQTGASIDIPSGAGNERVVARLGPGRPKDVLSSLLNGSKFNYVILGESNNSGGVQKIILLSKDNTAGNTGAVTTAQNNIRAPSPSQAAEPPEDEYPPPEQETENQNQLVQPGMAGGGQFTPDGLNGVADQNALGARTPEQMLQELQRIQQQQQQMQQQLNPANQQSPPLLPSQPAPMPSQPQ
jgi:hypothetical protein